ncbi:MAG: hypothetical protein PVI03_00905 [Candidatus Thorarchaeota archaeon]|jgi:uncharacterized membrane protein
MKFSNIYLGMTIVGVLMGILLGLFELYSLMSLPILIGIIFFAVFLFARIFETLAELETRNKKSYEEMEKIFKEKFAKKKSKRVKK